MANHPIVRKLFHYYWLLKRPMTLGVRGLLTDKAGRVLLVKHTYVSGWYLPGGGVERGETAQMALEKEILEEARIKLLESPVLLSIHSNSRISARDHVLFYKCGAWSEAGKFEPNREIAEIGFFACNDLPEGTTPATRQRILEAFENVPPTPHW